MRLDRTTFFAYARRAPFGGRLSTSQVDGISRLLNEWETGTYGSDPRHLSYALATVFHETGGRMIPVREGFAKSDADARKVVKARRYGKRDPVTGHVYYGRGDVQLTWAENYKSMGEILGIPLYKNPDLALEPKTSARILFEGMTTARSGIGDFTRKTLDQYFNDKVDDPAGARRIINGTDKASLIAGYHKQFLGAVTHALAAERPEDVMSEDAKADDVAPGKSKGLWGMFGSGIAAAATSLLAAVNNPWALGAVVFIGIGVGVGAWLVLSGRIEIKRSHAI